MPATRQPSRSLQVILAIGIFLTALNMRTTIVSVPPVMDIVRKDTGLSSSAAGLIVTLPIVCFALLSLTAPRVAQRIGLDRAVILSMLFVTIGVLIRVIPTIPALFIGTAVIGAALSIGNVLLPSVIKRDFPQRPGLMTAIYGLGMSLGGTIAAALMVPVYQNTTLGWRGTMALLAIPAGIAVIGLLPRLRLSREFTGGVDRREQRVPRLWGDLLAWQIAIVMGLQSFVFYGLGTWAPTILIDNGMSETTAGYMWSICNFGAIPASFVMPMLFTRGISQRVLMFGVAGVFTTCILGLLLAPTTLTPLWMISMGIAGASSFAAVLLLIVERSPDAAHAAALSGMSQAVGYGIAATAPFLFGAIHDLTGGWQVPTLLVLLLMVPFVWASQGACRPMLVGQGGKTVLPVRSMPLTEPRN